MKKVVFFGLGAVGSVVASCLSELNARSGDKSIQFVFVVRNQKQTKKNLYKAKRILKSAQFLEVANFDAIFKNPDSYAKHLGNADVFINAATPDFNEPILKIAIKFKASYADLASDMYNDKTLKTLHFPQQVFHKKLQSAGVFGLINIGISPGVTNFLVGEKLMQLRAAQKPPKIKTVNVYLLEQINSDQIVFSWSPKVALEELEQRPRFIKNGKLLAIEPFSESRSYQFPHFERSQSVYPIYQEEVLSLHDSFPEIGSLKISTGGSEVELIKNLFQLNLLSKQNVECVAGDMSVAKIVRMVLPGMESPEKIERLLKAGIIKYAQFAATAEIIFETKDRRGKAVLITETIGLSFHRYLKLLGTPYSGATYISYPTGVGAAVLLFYTHKAWLKNKKNFAGILKAEELPARMGTEMVDEVKREMCTYMIDFVSHSHSLMDGSFSSRAQF